MSQTSAPNKNSLRANRSGHFTQFPVDAYVGKVRLDTNSPVGDFLRIVVMNEQSTTQRLPNQEYIHNNTDVSLENVASFTMRYASESSDEQAIRDFVGTMPEQLRTPQEARWLCGVQRPVSARSRLYKAVDPDDATKMIGVLIEQDEQGRVSRITWYKTWNAKTIFYRTPSALDFEIVTAATGEPSTDPNDIGGWTWYFTTSTSLGSS